MSPQTNPAANTGLSFELTKEQQDLRARVHEFAQQRITPVAADMYRTGEYPVEIIQAMGREGFFGLSFPEEYGGSGGGLLELCLAIEEVGRADQSLGITLESSTGLGAAPIARWGTPEQKERWLPDLLTGQKVAGFGLTEPGGGSDTVGMKTRAELDGDEWVINGSKSWIGNAGSPITSHCTVTAVTGTQPDGRPEITTIIVPAGTPGFEPQERNDLVGWRTIDNRNLVFRDCRVPVSHTLGERGQGLRNFLGALDGGRVAIAALAVGMIQGCLDECLRYAGEREAFGRAIGTYQGISFKIADMAVRAQLARDAVWRAAWLADQGRPYSQEAYIAKLFASEAAATTAREAVQVFGGKGFSNESLVGRFYRDAKILEIGEGTSEVQRMLIGRLLGLPKPA
ncbi:butyryl-CoA dehydrogenase [Kineococcus xinjiangensis]|uniref:Butyryl-CoA dehydrogenase n=1 Tax=Kineococcus xinjiangensis TaxID=512762 RepID=A0A2S6IU21_9ACTN|nr:acyl-CoA dehydrogenase family protein [Kineococcus xinjiangensis]PPK97743.1 butyryl-CoA dehydrogenase [Kineococcus xinjiangensis]